MGRLGGVGAVGSGNGSGDGGGMISLGWGSWNLRLISAWPLSRDLMWRLAGLPSLQKLVTCENRCWAKQWAVGVHCAGGILRPGGRDIRSCGPSSCACGRPPPGDEKGLGAFPMPRQRLSPPVSATSLKKFYQASKLGRPIDFAMSSPIDFAASSPPQHNWVISPAVAEEPRWHAL